MIKKSLKLLLFVFICVMVIIYLRFGCEESSAVDVMPDVVGSAATDSVRINFGIMDTTYYPAVLDADSLIILIYPPDNAAPESTADGGTGVFNLTTGYYQYHRRGSNATPDVGIYTVCVKAWRGEAVRGIGTCSYLVTGAGTYHYGVQDSIRDLVKDSVANAILDANKPNFKATGFATAADGDSVIQAIADANKANFKATGFATSADGDSVIQAIADANKANFKATGFATSSDMDSVNQAIADANKANFKATGFATSSEGDSLIAAIADANKANFKATGFATAGSVHVAISDANKANFKATGFATSADGDSMIQAIADANKPNFRATGFATSSEGDSIIAAISDANKANFMADVSDVADTVNAILDTIQAHAPHGNDWGQGGGSLAAITDTVNAILDTIQAHAPHGNDWGQGGGSLAAITDTVNALLDTLQAGFGSRTAIGDTIGREASTFDPTSDNVAVVDSVTKVARVVFVDSVDTIIKTVSSAPTGWGAYTVTLYLLSDADSTPVAGVIINIYDSTSGVFWAGHITPANGIRQFSLDASTYTIHLQDPPNAITSPEYMTISADTTDTFWVNVFDPGTPPSGDECKIWSLVSNMSGAWLSGCKLLVEIPRKYHPVTLSGTVISPYSVSATSNDTGYVNVNVYESGELTGRVGAGTVKMLITLIAPNGQRIVRTLAEIPDAADWEIVW